MTARMFIGIALTISTANWAADFHPLDVKTGQWEATMTVETNGPPPVPPEALARMTPQQRAALEERTKPLAGRTTVRKTCVTQEKLDKPLLWGQDDKACSYSLTTATGRAQEIQVECAREKMKSSGAIRIEAQNSENVKGTVHMNVTQSGETSEINSSFTAKWIAPACTAKRR